MKLNKLNIPIIGYDEYHNLNNFIYNSSNYSSVDFYYTRRIITNGFRRSKFGIDIIKNYK